jgi:uncharacterized lipoprotein NlpE involved in copper resistance
MICDSNLEFKEELMIKKWLITLISIVLLFCLAGCANNQKVPTSTQSQSTSAQLPEGHPIETPDQSGDLASQKVVESKIIDWLNKNYSGEWKVAGTTLSKGNYTENGNYKIADGIETLFPGTMGVSIFVGNERISSSVKQGTERVLKGYPTPPTVGDVLKSGKTTSTLSSGFLKVYIPFQASGRTVAVLTVSVPHQ